MIEAEKKHIAVVLIGALFVSLLMMPSVIKGADTESKCVQCHINLKKLMDLSWEVKKQKKGKEVSKHTSGEG